MICQTGILYFGSPGMGVGRLGWCHSGFLLQGGKGGAPQNDFCPPKRRLPPKIFQKTIERTTETTAYCFKNNGLLSPPTLKFFSSRKPALFRNHFIIL